MPELTQNQKLLRVPVMTGFISGIWGAAAYLSSIIGLLILRDDNNGYGDSTGFEDRALIGGLIFGASVGLVATLLDLSGVSLGSSENPKCSKEVVKYLVCIMLSGLIGYALSEHNDDVSLGKFMLVLAVGAAVTVIPVFIAIACCLASCAICLTSFGFFGRNTNDNILIDIIGANDVTDITFTTGGPHSSTTELRLPPNVNVTTTIGSPQVTDLERLRSTLFPTKESDVESQIVLSARQTRI